MRLHIIFFVGLFALSAWNGLHARASENLIRDPGFERFTLDAERGCYVPTDNAVWKELGAGMSSVVFDASDWKAPEEMLRTAPLGFTPGTRGFEQLGREANRAGSSSSRM